MIVRLAQLADIDALAQMCVLLWPHTTFAEERIALEPILAGQPPGMLPSIFLIALDGATPAGFAEVSLRSYADGCDPAHPVGYLEGWFVDERYRARGVGRALLTAAEDWARSQGCREFASDTWIDNLESQRAHQALGFEVVDRVVTFRKAL